MVFIEFYRIADYSQFFRRVFESPQWRSWDKSDSGLLTVVVDGIDEGCLRIPSFIGSFVEDLKGSNLQRLRLIMACRGKDWDSARGQELFSLWGSTQESARYDLCPLRRKDLLVAATARSVDASKFFHALWSTTTSSLAALPVTLFFIIEEFRSQTTNETLSISARALYRKGMGRLLFEQNTAHKLDHFSPLLPASVRRSAARLALLYLVTGSAAILSDESPEVERKPQELHFFEILDPGEPLSVPTMRRALSSPLFISLGEHRYGFSHHSFAEYLASEALSCLSLRQLRSLLCRQDEHGEYVIPQLSNVAAWTAGTHGEFRDHLLRVDPLTVFAADLSDLEAPFKERLVAALLSLAESDNGFSERIIDTFFSGLGHPGLADQLRPVISSSQASERLHHLALSLAGKAQVKALVPEIQGMFWHPKTSNHLRNWAAKTLADLVTGEHLAILEPLAEGKAGPDPGNVIRGWAIRGLVPSRWKIRDAIPWLHPRSEPGHLGIYDTLFDYYFPEYLEDDDVAPLLIYFKHQSGPLDSHHPEGGLSSSVLLRAIELLHRRDVAEALVSLDSMRFENHRPSCFAHRKEIQEKLISSSQQRYELISIYLNDSRISKDNLWLLQSQDPIFPQRQDVRKLLENISSAPEERQPVWAEMIWMLISPGPEIVEVWDTLLQRISEVPALGDKYSWLFRIWDIDGIPANEEKARLQRQLSFSKEHIERRHFRLRQWEAKLEAQLQKVRESACGDWAEIWSLLCENEGHTGWSSHINLENRITWEGLTEEQRTVCRLAASAWFESDSLSLGRTRASPVLAHAAVAALLLIFPDGGGYPGHHDSAKSSAFVTDWLPLLAASCFDWDQDHLRPVIFCRLHALDPGQCTRIMVTHILDGLQARPQFCSLSPAGTCWTPEMSVALVAGLETLSGWQARYSGLQALVKLDRDVAAAAAIRFLSTLDPVSTSKLQCVAALAGAIKVAGGEAIPEVKRLVGRKRELHRSVWNAAICDDFHRADVWLSHSKESELGEMYDILSSFQSLKKPVSKSSSKDESSREDSIRGLRDQLPAYLAERSTAAGCSELQRLIFKHPEQRENLKWYYNRALRGFRGTTWQRPSIPQAVTLLRDPDSRYLASSQDLLEVVLESVVRLQRHLKQQLLPAVEDLWSWSGGGHNREQFRPKDEESISDYIARWLISDIGGPFGCITNREVQPQRRNRMDILVEAVPSEGGSFADTFRVVIEVKCCSNTGVKTSITRQLVDQYLRPHGLTCGIYLVAWFVCQRWHEPTIAMTSRNFDEAEEELRGYAAPYSLGQSQFRIEPVLLNCSLP